MNICVLCRISRLGQEPSAFYLARQRHSVAAILNRWAEPPHRYFDVRAQGRPPLRAIPRHNDRDVDARRGPPEGPGRGASINGRFAALLVAMVERARVLKGGDGPAAPSSAKERARRRA